jgi:hypothetical protein
MSTLNTIVCPNCKHEFAIEAALKNNLEKEVSEKMRAEFNQKAQEWQAKQLADLRQKELENETKLKLQQAENETKFKAQQAEIEAKLKVQQSENEAKLKIQQAEMLDQIKKKIQSENDELILALKKDNEEQTQKISNLKKLEVEFMEKEKALKEDRENMELGMKKWALEKQSELEDKIKKEENIKNELKFKEYEKQLEDQKKLVEEMRRKAEQGSMQLQGEVQELAIEEWIESKFPYDQLEEIKKGARGGDCVQIVYNRTGQQCGKIYYESKRTKDFQPTWIEKFKVDMREIGADIGVIVTQTMPKDMPRFGEKEGIWICTYEEFKALSFVLRDSLLRVNSVKIIQANKGDKMSVLYDYLTSSEFRMSVESIVEGFSAMQDGLNKEKRAMQKIWKEREKQIEKVINSTINMYGSVKGIAGSAVQDIKLLGFDDEFTEGDIDDNI